MWRGTPVAELMSRPAVTVIERTWFRELVRLMDERGIGCLPVMSAQGELEGVVTDGDLLLKACRAWVERRPTDHEPAHRRVERARAAGLTARDLMSTPAVTIAPTAVAAEAAALLREREIKHLVVVESDGAPVGVLSRRDLLIPLCRGDEQIEAELTDLADRTLRAHRGRIHIEIHDGVVGISGHPAGDPAMARFMEQAAAVEGVVGIRADRGWMPVVPYLQEVPR